MVCYSVQARDRIFVKGNRCLSFAKNVGKNISKNTSGKYGQKLLDHAKKSATDALKTSSRRVVQETAEATGDLIGNKIAETVQSKTLQSEPLAMRAKVYDGKNAKVSRSSPQNNSETIANKHDKEIPKERYTSPEERQKIINDLVFNIII